LRCSVGDGKSILFWRDVWTSAGRLKDVFPRLFSISNQGNDTIYQMGAWVESEWVWHFRWRRRLYEWELADLERLNLLIQHIRPDDNRRDGVNWHGVEYPNFPIKVVTEKLFDDQQPIIPKTVSTFLWNIKVPPRVHITIWMACLGKLRTGDFLVDKGLVNPNQALCPFCISEVETNSHILFTCQFSWSLWMKVLKWWSIHGVLPNHCAQFALAWRCLAPSRRRGKLWNLIFGCVLWSIWYERNRIRFHAGTLDGDHLFYTLKIRVGTWAKELLGLDLPSFNTTTSWF
jgi:reverse transcriptase-like protein